MMVAHATDEKGQRIIVLGLERGNIQRLEQGRAMRICAKTHPGFPLENVEIVIFFGETPRDLVKTIEPSINTETKIITVPIADEGKPS